MADVITWTLYMGGFALVISAMFYVRDILEKEVSDTGEMPKWSIDLALALLLIALFLLLTSIG